MDEQKLKSIIADELTDATNTVILSLQAIELVPLITI